MARRDYAFPFRIDPASGQAARTGYETHVEQMIGQLLLTSPGERIDLPDFGSHHRGARLGKVSPHRIAADEVDRIISLYRDRYAGWTVKHFHERAQEWWLGLSEQFSGLISGIPAVVMKMMDPRSGTA